MFDFGNKKLIEDLKREVKFQNNLVGIGLAIQDELKKKNEILEKEKIEYQKTIEFLTNEIDKLKDNIKELEEEIETEKVGIKTSYIEISQSDIDLHGRETKCYKAIDYDYCDIKNKVYKKYKNNITYFVYKNYDEIVNPEEIDNSHYDKNIKTYLGIPCRTFQDLCMVNDFLETDNYKKYREECNIESIYDNIILKISNNKLECYIYNMKVKEFLKKFNDVKNKKYIHKNIKIYKQRTLPSIESYIFETEKEFMNIIKFLLYNSSDIKNKIINI